MTDDKAKLEELRAQLSEAELEVKTARIYLSDMMDAVAELREKILLLTVKERRGNG